MTLAPLLQASPVVQAHVAAALAAFGLGLYQLAAPKGGNFHRINGYVWSVLMVVVALSSFFIHTIRSLGPFSPIHILSGATLLAVPLALHAARSRKIERHRRIMRSLVLFALVIAGAFTLWPGRLMHEVVFASTPS